MPKFNMDPKKHPMPSQDPLVRNKNFKEVALGYDEAMEMISSLKAYPILSGYRGAGPLNVDALAKMMVQLGRLAVEREDIKELDINPVFVYENGVSAADALIVMEK